MRKAVETGRRQTGAGSVRRHHAGDRRGGRRDRRRLSIVRRDHAFGAQPGRRRSTSRCSSAPTSSSRHPPCRSHCPTTARRSRRPICAGDRSCAGRSWHSSSSRAPSKDARRTHDSASPCATSGSHSLPSSVSRAMRLRALPRLLIVHDIRNAVAREGELAGEMAVRVLIDDAADVVWIVAGEHAVHHHLRDRDLPAHRLAARLEIDRVGETLLRLGALRADELRAARPGSSAADPRRSPRPCRRRSRPAQRSPATRRICFMSGSADRTRQSSAPAPRRCPTA